MRRIAVIGAGRSCSSLIRYLLDNAQENEWNITVVDRDLATAEAKVNSHERGTSSAFDAFNQEDRKSLISNHDLVISMLPASMHFDVAKDCLEMNTPVITPSYVTDEMKALDSEAKKKGLLFLNEMGVDPGIDHMSAMKIIDEIKLKGGELERFESFTGGLIAPESDNNPWGYKFTWNPRNVVLAGQGGTAQFQQNHQLKYIAPHNLFKRVKPIEIEGYGVFEGYANRDSLSYKSVYGLENIPTLYRGTLRKQGYCEAWEVFVQLGMTTEDFVIKGSEDMTYRDFTNAFLTYNQDKKVEEKLRTALNLSDEVMDKLNWLGIFDETKIGMKDGTPAGILQHLLEQKWQLEEHDKDMIVMWHRFNYDLDGKSHELHSSMVSIGEDQTYTAMSNTVGLPVGIAAKMMMNGQMDLSGVRLPIIPEIYNPILAELEKHNIAFNEKLVG
ncbi:MAG: saccharopine dehydrogenase NADP-binding domain-containing protein [Flavobacteriales bacterium]|nr:saccharopine dehydrogenase NADP-binding domain-containing protein [Flavobacteriales bacterium]